MTTSTKSSAGIPANPAIWSFGLDAVCDTLVQFCRAYPDLPLVSVGCGMALVERYARSHVRSEFFLVDPRPFSYYTGIDKGACHQLIVEYGMPATHSYTRELVATNPCIATGNQCLLLLNWCDYGMNDYDMEAVRLLKPRAILAIVDTTGSAGSRQFHDFLDRCHNTTYHPVTTHSIRHAKKDEDTCECSHETIAIRWLATDRTACQWQVEHIHECQQIHDETNLQNIKTLETRAYY